METEEISDRYVAPSFVNGLEAYDGEINLRKEENMISNEFVMKLCLDHEVKCVHKVVKKDLIVALRRETYFVKFIINPEEDDVKPKVVLRRSFMRLTKGIVDFRNETITIYPELNHFLDSSRETKKIDDDWDLLLDDLDFGDIPEIEGVEISSFVCKMGKNIRNKRKQLEKYQMIYSDIGPSLSTEKPLTQEDAAREALAIDICKRFAIIEEERLVIETMAYSVKYKKSLDEICLDNMKLDGEIKKEEEEAIIKVKGEALLEKEDPGAFVIPIRLEAKINLNALANTGSDINVMPYRVYKELCRKELKNVNRGIRMLNHSKAEPIDTRVLIGRGFLYTYGSILNTIQRITSTFDGICHQTFYAAKTSLKTEKSDSDDEEDYGIQRNKFGALVYRAKLAKYLNCHDPLDRSIALQEVVNPLRKICVCVIRLSVLLDLHLLHYSMRIGNRNIREIIVRRKKGTDNGTLRSN
nr:hypothetical protein [Tanacetum cinerariifolium]